jgi:hypothetical protein
MNWIDGPVGFVYADDVKRALLELVLLFWPVSFIGLYWIFGKGGPNDPVDFGVAGALAVYALVPALVLWALYRIVRWTFTR